MPSKEAHFFDTSDFDKGIDWYRSTYFNSSSEEKVAFGDITPAYLHSDVALERIRSTLGCHIKLIVIYREPVARLFSHYLHDIRLLNRSDPFSVSDKSMERYFLASQYANVTAKLFSLFPRQNILSLIFERHIAGPALAERGVPMICDFLGISSVLNCPVVHKARAALPWIETFSNSRSVMVNGNAENVNAGDILVISEVNTDSGIVGHVIRSPNSAITNHLSAVFQNMRDTISPEVVRDLHSFFKSDADRMRDILKDDLPEWHLENIRLTKPRILSPDDVRNPLIDPDQKLLMERVVNNLRIAA